MRLRDYCTLLKGKFCLECSKFFDICALACYQNNSRLRFVRLTKSQCHAEFIFNSISTLGYPLYILGYPSWEKTIFHVSRLITHVMINPTSFFPCNTEFEEESSTSVTPTGTAQPDGEIDPADDIEDGSGDETVDGSGDDDSDGSGDVTDNDGSDDDTDTGRTVQTRTTR